VQLSEETYQTRLRQLGASAKADGTITITAPIAGTVADRDRRRANRVKMQARR